MAPKKSEKIAAHQNGSFDPVNLGFPWPRHSALPRSRRDRCENSAKSEAASEPRNHRQMRAVAFQVQICICIDYLRQCAQVAVIFDDMG